MPNHILTLGYDSRAVTLPGGIVVFDDEEVVVSADEFAQVSALVASGALVHGGTTLSPVTDPDEFDKIEKRLVSLLSRHQTVVAAAAAATDMQWIKVSEFPPSRTATVATVISSSSLTAGTGTFSSDDVGAPISGTGIPANATIATVSSGTAATLSAAATATGSITATIGIIKVSGLPVVWIDQSEQLTPVPVNPPAPTWNNTTSQFTVPAGVVGVDYVWTSGGGGVGATLTAGSTLSTSGAFPRTVTITPVAKPGYVLFAATEMVHDFPNPTTVTALVSDAFTGGAVTDIDLRSPDNTLGGTGAGDDWVTGDPNSWGINSSGQLASGFIGGWSETASIVSLFYENLRIELDVVSISGVTTGNQTGLIISMRGAGGNGALSLALNGTQAIAYGALQAGGVTPLGPNMGHETGHWSLQLVGTTATVTTPSGVNHHFDMSGPTWKPPNVLNKAFVLQVAQNGVTGFGAVVDNVKISRIGG